MERNDSELISKKRRIDSPGDIPNPNGEGQSADNVVHKLYFKGLVSDEVVADGGERTVRAGYGVAICDEKDNLLFEIKDSLSDGEISRRGVEIRALIHGLNKAYDSGIRHVSIFCDDYMIYQYVDGRDKPTQKKFLQLVEEVQSLRGKMAYSDPLFVARNDVKFAFKLAREAIGSQSSSVVAKKLSQGETCAICLEEIVAERMFLTDKCVHRHCFSCVKQYVEVKLLRGDVPTCLGEGCKIELTLETCSKILTQRVIDMWNKKVREDSIPAAERVYCPYPNCSMLMSKTELSSSAGSDQSSVRECVKCNGLFCMDCKVPSHTDLSCADYKKLHPDTLVDDMKLKSLAEDKKWRLCVKCRNMIELSHGCNHMTCRCGYEFCYKCGTEWNKNKQSCPSGCQLTGLGDYDIEDDDDSEHTCETDMCQCYYDENGRRFRNYEEYIDRQIVDYPMPPLPPLPPGEVQEYEQFDIVEGNGDDYDDDYYNYGGLTESDDEGGFSEAFFIDYYSL